jgi:CRP-like cAMP-binding protein
MNPRQRPLATDFDLAGEQRKTSDGESIANRIIASLPQVEFGLLRPLLTQVRFLPGSYLHAAGEPPQFVYFPNTGLVSFIVAMKDGKKVEVGLTGNEGLVGAEAIFELDRSPHSAVLFNGGEGLRIQLDELRPLLAAIPHFQFIVGQQTAGQALQAEQLAACNRLHSVEQRLARWLLMLQTRTNEEVHRVTHDFLAAMLGTDRPSISIAAGLLQRNGSMTYSRGLVRVVDHQRLEECACECYEVLQQLSGSPALT